MVVHIISVAFTGFMIYLSNPGSDLFSWHPTCMSVAFMLLLLQAIVLFSPESSLFPTTPKPVSNFTFLYHKDRLNKKALKNYLQYRDTLYTLYCRIKFNYIGFFMHSGPFQHVLDSPLYF